jgi:hypothetical protein
MKNGISVLSALGLAVAPIAVQAQVTVLDYQGNVITGLSTYLPSGFTTPTQTYSLPTAGYTGTVSVEITLSGSLAANDLTLTSFKSNLAGTDGTNVSLYVGPGPLSNFTPSGSTQIDFCGPGDGCIDFTTSHGAITGATIGISGSTYHSAFDTLSIGPGGDSLSYLYGSVNGGCQSVPLVHGTNSAGTVFTYSGPTIRPCSINAGSSAAGTWTVTGVLAAPEIDPASAAGGLTLLLGGIAVLRGRRLRS